MSNINLVSAKAVGLEEELKRLKIFRVISLICLIATLLLAVLVFVLNITLPTDTVKKEQQATITGISFFNKKLTQYDFLSDRIKNISAIVSKRQDYGSQINEISQKVPSDASIDTLNVSSGKMSIVVSSTSLLSINKFIDDMVAFGAKGKIIKNVIIQGLSLDFSSGKYSLSIMADIL